MVIRASVSVSADRVTRAKVGAKVAEVLEAAARETEAGARRNTRRVDTGNMKAGWRTEGRDRTWTVYTPVEYAVYWEFGHRNPFARRYFPPEPMLRPAAMDAWQRAIGRLRRDAPEVFMK